MKLRLWYKLGFLGCLCVSIYCCSSPKKEGDFTVFRYNQPNMITSLDPAFSKAQNNIWAVHHLFNGLVALDDSLNVIPDIAKSWVVSDDGLTLEFHLRKGVYFHKNICFGKDSTRAVVASDFVYSLNRLNDTLLNAPGSWLFSDKKHADDLFYAPNDSTFIIQLAKPFMPILGMLTMQYCSVVPKEAIEYYGNEFRSNPVGTGPYQLKRWVEDQGLFLKKNPHYYALDSLSPDYIKTTFISDKQVAMYELLKGKLDLVAGLESSFINDILTREGELNPTHQQNIQYVKTPYLNTEYLGINWRLAQDHPMLQQKSFRQALNYAIDRPLMLQSLRNGVGLAADAGFIPNGLPAYDPTIVNGYYYDTQRAKSLLQQAQYSGEEIEISTNNEYLDLCTFIARQWEAIGVKVKINVMDTGILRDGMRNQAIPLFRASWIADYPDEESFLCMYYSANPAPPNYTRFINKKFDQLYLQALQTPDESQRRLLYQEMDRILVDEAPVVFLFYDQSSVFHSKRINGYTNNGLNLLQTNFEIKQ